MKIKDNELKQIYTIELSLGNEVKHIDEPAGTSCPLAIIFKDMLHFEQLKEQITLSDNIEFWV